MFVHRFIWECFNGLKNDKEKVVFHINKNSQDNRLKNLELITPSEMSKKIALPENVKFFKMLKRVKACNCNTNKITHHKSMNSAAKELVAYTS